jgi:Mannosyltransferase (PIG-V)
MTAVADVSPERTTPVARLAGRLRWLSPADLAVLRIWLLSRCAVLALTWPAISIFRGSAKSSVPWLSIWQNWDAVRLQSIAQYGYFGPAGHPVPNQIAFFPGFPIVLAAVHLIAAQWTVSGLLVSFIAGGVAMVALGRLTDLDYEPGSGSRAVLFLVASPAAIFLAAAYTESLFLALALCCWLAARNGRWTLAVLLAGATCVIRVNGLFLCAALAIEIIRAGHGQRIRSLATFVPALLPLAGYELYLRLRTGDWLAWQHAELAGWQRTITNPIATFRTTWTAGFGREFAAPINFVFQLEILAVLIGVVTTIVLLWYRRWPEAVYAGLTIAALATSIWYESVPRALLQLWPLWCGLAAAAARRAWIGQLYLALSVPICAAIGLLFLSGNWAG